MEQVAAAGGPPPATVSYAPEPLRFTGTGSGYFGIWIVNLLLTIVTLGIYSAWAKVRRLQYFYRHTELAGSSFDFHGSAARILLGRIIAVILLLLYNFSIQMRSIRTLAAVLVGLALLMPWLLRNSFRFRLYNASWRGTRFHFKGSLGGAYRVFLLNGILALITLYILAPFTHQRIKAWQHGNSWFGRTPFRFQASAGEFYGVYLLTLGVMVAAGVILGVAGIGGALAGLMASSKGGHADPRAVMRALLLFYGAFILVALVVGPVFRALITNLIWNNTRLGEHRIECRISPWKLAWIGVSNLVLVVVT
ncbi:MAG TPA: YjgN family protein, partial [Steroidobacteraceae bacterium]|nr:YjgN family protein [Steroidobacteraceae bacterium]